MTSVSACCLAAAALPAVFSSSPSPSVQVPSGAAAVSPRSLLLSLRPPPCALRRRRRDSTLCMAAGEDGEEEETTRRHPLDFPFEYTRPKPPSRLHVFPKFPAMPTPLPTWLPYDQAPDDEIDEDEEEFLEEPEQPEQAPDELY